MFVIVLRTAALQSLFCINVEALISSGRVHGVRRSIFCRVDLTGANLLWMKYSWLGRHFAD